MVLRNMGTGGIAEAISIRCDRSVGLLEMDSTDVSRRKNINIQLFVNNSRLNDTANIK